MYHFLQLRVFVRHKYAVWVATVIAALITVPATYALLRAYEVLFKNEPNPATIVWSPHIAVFWRMGIAVYVAGMVAPLAYLAARHDLARLLRVLYPSLLIAGTMIAIQGLFMP
jgi:hypothetical protein